MPYFRFMTGASQYRINAATKEEAIQIAFEDLQPGEDTRAVILNTIYSEEEARQFQRTHLRAVAATHDESEES